MLARRLPEIEFDLSLEDFGDTPIGLGQISTNPAIIMVGGFLAVFLGIAAIPGLGGLGLAALGLLATANDLKHTRSKDLSRPKLKPGGLDENPNLPPPIDVAADPVKPTQPAYSEQSEYTEPSPWAADSRTRPDPPDLQPVYPRQQVETAVEQWEAQKRRECSLAGITLTEYQDYLERFAPNPLGTIPTPAEVAGVLHRSTTAPPPIPTTLIPPSGGAGGGTGGATSGGTGGASGGGGLTVQEVERFKATVEARAPHTQPSDWTVRGTAYHLIRQSALLGCSKNWVAAQFRITKNTAPWREMCRIYDSVQ